MTAAKWTVTLPRGLRDEELTIVEGVAEVTSTIIFEAEDEWELHDFVSGLNDELAAMGSTVYIPRPARIEPPLTGAEVADAVRAMGGGR